MNKFITFTDRQKHRVAISINAITAVRENDHFTTIEYADPGQVVECDRTVDDIVAAAVFLSADEANRWSTYDLDEMVNATRKRNVQDLSFGAP
jgi:hypothetical protein